MRVIALATVLLLAGGCVGDLERNAPEPSVYLLTPPVAATGPGLDASLLVLRPAAAVASLRPHRHATGGQPHGLLRGGPLGRRARFRGAIRAGFTFGSLSKAFNLDVVLSALESTGEGKVVSTPRVSALDNKEAKIEQGISIPFATSQAGGATNVQFVDAKLSLIVTPHATPDNKIFMKLQVTRNAPDTSLLGAGGQPSIRKNEATTEMLLTDGETAVIGGILVIDRGQTITKVPFFADIPLIGWLFKSKTVREDKRELLIFITPRVVRQEVI